MNTTGVGPGIRARRDGSVGIAGSAGGAGGSAGTGAAPVSIAVDAAVVGGGSFGGDASSA